MKTFEEAVEDVLMYLSFEGKNAPLGHFDEAYPILDYGGRTLGAHSGGDIAIPKVNVSEVVRLLDHSVILNNDCDQFGMMRWSAVTYEMKRKLRGKIHDRHLWGPHPMLRHSCGAVSSTKAPTIRVRYLAHVNGSLKYVDTKEQIRAEPVTEEMLDFTAGVAVLSRLRWTVRLGVSGGASVSLFTDPQGAAETFRLRDVPAGAARRAAIRHWVEGHWRKNRGSAGEHEVRKHLRGASKFQWNGLSCEIGVPPLADAVATRP